MAIRRYNLEALPNGEIAFTQITPLQTVTAQTLIDALTDASNNKNVATPQLPRGCRWYTENGQNITLVVELEPDSYFIKTVDMTRGLRLAMPWQYFLFHLVKTQGEMYAYLDAYYLLWSKTPVRDKEARQLIPARVPNVGSNGLICFGNTAPDSRLPLGQRIDTIVNDFYSPNSLFNQDLEWNLPSKYGSFREWYTDSNQNRLCYMSWPDFNYANMNLSSLFFQDEDRLASEPRPLQDIFANLANGYF